MKPPSPQTALAMLGEIATELARAQSKFPSSNLAMIALTEQVGELAKALLDEPVANVRKEAIQVACMALRVAIEGDPSVNSHRFAKGLDLLGSSMALPTASASISMQVAPAQRFQRLGADGQPLPADASNFAVQFDSKTGKTWLARRVTSDRVSHAKAVELASQVDLFGHNDWHLPGIEELESIRDLSSRPAIHPEFKGLITANHHWSSSVVPDDEDYARVVLFDNGYSDINYRYYEAYVLAVRDTASSSTTRPVTAWSFSAPNRIAITPPQMPSTASSMMAGWRL